MVVHRRISPDPSLGVRELALPLKDYMKERHNWDLLALLKKQNKTSWKTAPDVELLSDIAGLYVKFAKLSPNLCLSGSKLRMCLQKLDEEMKLNTTTMTRETWSDKLDTWLRIAAAQYRALKRKYICSMKKASEQEKQNIDSVLTLVEDQEQCNDLSCQAPVASEKEKQEQCQAIVPYVVTNSSEPKAATNNRLIFKKILEKEDSCPESPSPAKMKAEVASSHKEPVKNPLALQTFLAQQPKDPVLVKVQKNHTKKKKKNNKQEPAKKDAPKSKGKKPMKKAANPKKKAAKKAVSPAAIQQQEVPEAPGKKVAKAKTKSQGKAQWSMMFYKNGPAYALREKGGKQLFQITTLHRSPTKVRGTCSTAKEMLEKGESPEKVKIWAKSQHS